MDGWPSISVILKPKDNDMWKYSEQIDRYNEEIINNARRKASWDVRTLQQFSLVYHCRHLVAFKVTDTFKGKTSMRMNEQ